MIVAAAREEKMAVRDFTGKMHKKNDLLLNYMTKFSRAYLRTELYLIQSNLPQIVEKYDYINISKS